MLLNSKTTGSGQIKITRDSVCMGDDVSAPNADLINFNEKDMLSDIFKKVEKYLPQMADVVWAVDSGRTVLGYIIMDKNKRSVYEICQPDKMFFEMEIRSLHCSYFHSQSRGAENLFEKARRSMQERFQHEILIEKGSLCFWGEWFGRPYDNIHIIESVKCSSTEIVIHFDHGETLYITDPANIINEKIN